MKRTAIAAAAIVGVAAYGATEKTAFTVDFESPYTLAGDSNWSNTTDAEIVTDQTKNSQVLSVDSSSEVLYTPAVADQTSKVSLDVYLTAGTEAPTVPSGAKLVIYLDSSGDLKGCVDGSGSSWTTIASDVAANTWTNITMTFSSGSVIVATADGDSQTLSNANVPATVTSVGFQGTGLVDNFTGKYFKEYGYASDDSTAGSEISGATIEVDDSTKAVTFNYASTAAANDVKFVRIYDDKGKYVTVRVNGNSGSADASKLSGTITKVVAYYGESVSNVDSSTPTTPTSAAVTDENGTPKVGVTVNGKSGVYYTLVQPDGTAISDSVLVAPQNDGEPVTLKAPVSRNAWGTVKFQVKATDTALTVGN